MEDIPLEPLTLIAQGRTADVYAWKPGQVLKLYHDWFERENIMYEAGIARAVHASGVPTPAPGEIIEVNGRIGLVYEEVKGISMLDAMQKAPWRAIQYGRHLAELHVKMHNSPSSAELPSQRRILIHKIQTAAALPASLKEAALSALQSLPDGDRVCHGDFHPANVLVTENGPVVIDWIDGSRGRPQADVARTTIISLGAAATAQISNPLLKFFVRLFHTVYLRRYFTLRPHGKDEYRQWLPVVAAARLNENILELESWLVHQARMGLDG